MKNVQRLYRPVPFFGIDFVLTWVPLWLLVFGRRLGWFARGDALMIAAGVSATVSALAFVYATRDRRFIRDFWIRAIDPTRIGGVWWLVILGSQLFINVVAVLLSSLGGEGWGATGGGFEQLALSQEFLAAPIGFLLFVLVFGPIPEELGWRGYGLDALRSRMNLLQASATLAVIWAVWHLPLVFLEGSFQNGLLKHPATFMSYFIAFVPSSILMSWIYYRTRRSTLSAILFHFAGNAAGEIFQIAPATRVIQTALGLVFAALVLWLEWDMFAQGEFWIGEGRYDSTAGTLRGFGAGKERRHRVPS
jgi:membrane protease YdiL (CAAX protease family)